ncbi:preprotein translocase subunit YajC [Serpentinicella sp. ANB-PHB4]|uniref:preprotein translocase subunit YajC n=1 Tax=Serpentinicella sp. ANB-PHB4 TaxID=3074076 RepID=UPI00285E105C|nr:preprotein translocase subunit YajC [Serpentinicella sp. ANB-PHB4]MDR5658060.1 preprotein translocase subunit YajC [Serpentinicella sp. ANB-PHB4]
MPAELTGLILPIGFLAFIYFLVIRPQQKKEKKVREMRNNLKVGDSIITIGGIYGNIVKIKEDLITIEVGADKTKLSVAKWAIGNITTENE